MHQNECAGAKIFIGCNFTADSPQEVDQKTDDHETDCSEDEHVTPDEEFDWTIDQTPFEDPSPILSGPKYGFAHQKSGIFERLQVFMQDII